ncbi:mitochondrial import receptor subunit tom22 [Diaporthe amygdali]|uniref:mitochondrial import receptor subunit tom22 n=1 Tax=Phomopsis amygdali TaxID=1214568 RepID=UPI0022FE8138|nr:mitochondrial import receptor subunit tom22 [Diaporthe amygdali]KAJ0108651.1 mitochondrial import receptor subunit tom22 [Diaporthe amygdali]
MDFSLRHLRWEHQAPRREPDPQPREPALAARLISPIPFEHEIAAGLFTPDRRVENPVLQPATPNETSSVDLKTDDADRDYDFVNDFANDPDKSVDDEKMVQLVEVEDEHFQHVQEGPVEDDGDYTDTDSEISNDSDYDPTQESLAERISALRDIVPPTTRAWFWNKFQTTQRVVKGVIFFAGRSMWSISVSALLIGVPFALCWAEEQQVIAMEQEARMREMGADVLTAGGGEGGTADRVGQALGKEGGVETKAAGL